MNIEIKDREELSRLTTKAMWRKWVKTHTFSSSVFSTFYLDEFLKYHSKPQTIWGAFHSMSPEPQILWKALAEKHSIKWAFPKLDENQVDHAGKMDFFESTEFRAHPQFVEMLEPSGQATLINPNQMAGILVPGLAFDNRGFRLGRGKGYYDRYLTDYQGLKVGLCNHDLFVLRPLPKENWDVRMDYVVTDEFVFSVG